MPWWRRKVRPVGQQGEDLAAHYLRRAGYKILERNVRLGRYELDIIAREGNTLCFVEVRTRMDPDPVPPEDSVGPVKQRHIRAAAHQYIARHPDPNAYYRFDVVAVILPKDAKPHITLYRDAFPDR